LAANAIMTVAIGACHKPTWWTSIIVRVYMMVGGMSVLYRHCIDNVSIGKELKQSGETLIAFKEMRPCLGLEITIKNMQINIH